MKTVIYPGSFDPLTLGHLDIIDRASRMFDKVIVCILINSGKKTSLFSLDERVIMLSDVLKKYDNVVVTSYKGLLIDFARENDTNIIIRGLREVTDFASELQMAQGNLTMSRSYSTGDKSFAVETVFLATSPEYSFISSTMVREYASYGRSVKGFVPDEILPYIEKKFDIINS